VVRLTANGGHGHFPKQHHHIRTNGGAPAGGPGSFTPRRHTGGGERNDLKHSVPYRSWGDANGGMDDELLRQIAVSPDQTARTAGDSSHQDRSARPTTPGQPSGAHARLREIEKTLPAGRVSFRGARARWTLFLILLVRDTVPGDGRGVRVCGGEFQPGSIGHTTNRVLELPTASSWVCLSQMPRGTASPRGDPGPALGELMSGPDFPLDV